MKALDTRSLVEALREDGHSVEVQQDLTGQYVVHVRLTTWSDQKVSPMTYKANEYLIEEVLSAPNFGRWLQAETGYRQETKWVANV